MVRLITSFLGRDWVINYQWKDLQFTVVVVGKQTDVWKET